VCVHDEVHNTTNEVKLLHVSNYRTSLESRTENLKESVKGVVSDRERKLLRALKSSHSCRVHTGNVLKYKCSDSPATGGSNHLGGDTGLTYTTTTTTTTARECLETEIRINTRIKATL